MKGLLFTYAMTCGGTLASIFAPFVGLLIYVCFSIIKPESLWFWAVPPGNYSRIVAIALLLGWILKGGANWQFGEAKVTMALLLGYWAWSVLGVALAPRPDLSWKFLETLTKIVLPFVVGLTVIDSVQKLKQLSWVILLSQAYVALELNLSYRSGFNRVLEIGFGDMDNNCVAISMVTTLGIAFFLGLQTRNVWAKGVALVSALMIGHVVLFSFSRGGMLGLIVTGLVTFFILPKKPGHYLVFLVAVLVAIRLAGPQVVERFGTTFADSENRDGSAESRIELWSACWDLAIKNPLLGVGPDHFPINAPSYGFPYGKEGHSLWMQTLAEQGFPGLGMLLSFYVVTSARLWKLLDERTLVPDPWIRDCARMVIAAIAGFVVSVQFVSLEGLELPYYVILIGAGALKLSSSPASAPVGMEVRGPQMIGGWMLLPRHGL